MFVKVAIPIPAAKTFTYAVPGPLAPSAAIGKQVLVPFGRKRLTGWIVEILSETPDRKIREVIELTHPEPFFNGEDLAFYDWVSRYYLHPLGRVLGEVLPGGTDLKSDRWLRPAAVSESGEESLSAGQKEILQRLASFPEGISLNRLRRMMGADNLYGDLRLLETSGRVISEERLNRPAVRSKWETWISLNEDGPAGIKLSRKQEALVATLREKGEMALSELPERLREAAFIRAMAQKGLVSLREKELFRRPDAAPQMERNGNGIAPNGAQEKALGEIHAGLVAGHFAPFLLHGVTGSGKTEVYLRSVAEVLQNGGGVIYLVPEIALTTQLLSRIGERFPEREIAVLHSGISLSARYDQWKRLRRGDLTLVVGARSAIFAPVRNLRLIVVDEEHDPSYKQDDRLRYNARDLALMRGKLAHAAVILGSATPGIQTFFQAKSGRYRHLALPARVDDRPLPRVEVVDMRTERDAQGRTPLLSHALVEALRETLVQRKQALLFLNRRGFHTFLFCPDCGHVFACPACDLALTHHAAEDRLKCHHCDFTAKPSGICPACKGDHVRSQGAGTERIEEGVGILFPEARIVRMDSDTTARRGNTEKILRKLDRREIDILIGTQMITKGHDFPDITLVGVLAADASMNLPDFRAAERTFQILTQVSGRGGRGDQPGRVVVQTFNPGNYAVRHAREHDYSGFYEEELPLRRELGYPPFSRIIGLHFSSLKKAEGKKAVTELGRRARELAVTIAGGEVDVIGPAESPLARLRGRYRWQMLLRGAQSGPLHLLAEKILEEKGHGLEIQADVDPVHFM
jgi:primosomal protein N' (replication factor Y) (superfamily II helicase)